MVMIDNPSVTPVVAACANLIASHGGKERTTIGSDRLLMLEPAVMVFPS